MRNRTLWTALGKVFAIHQHVDMIRSVASIIGSDNIERDDGIAVFMLGI